MILTIDIGNTTVGIGGVECRAGEYTLCFTGKLETNRDWTSAQYAPQLQNLLAERKKEISGAVISSVVPTVQTAFEETVREVLGIEPLIITYQSDLGIRLDVDFPEKLGRDRMVDSAWVAAHYPLPVVTVDLGTASTFNVIDSDRNLRGGVIAAGILTGLRALAGGTAQLPSIELEIPSHRIGRNTTQCMLSGAVYGTAAIVDGIVSGIEEELGESVTLVMTGGGSKYVSGLVRHSHSYDPDLIYKGLAFLYDKNRV